LFRSFFFVLCVSFFVLFAFLFVFFLVSLFLFHCE
jgi:hypothetical protein